MKSGVPTLSLLFLRKAYTHTLYNIHLPFCAGVQYYSQSSLKVFTYKCTTLIFDLEFNVQILSFERVRIVKLLLFCEKHEIREEEKPRRIRSRYVQVF